MSVNDGVIFGTSNYVDISIGDYYSFWVVGQILKLLEFLNLIILVLNVVEEAVVLLYGEYRQPRY